MFIILSGDWKTYSHLRIHRPKFDHDFSFVWDQMQNGGVTVSIRPYGDDSVYLGVSVCSLMDRYERAIGREVADRNARLVNVSGLSTYRRDAERGVRTIDTDVLVSYAVSAEARHRDRFRQFSKLSRNEGVPLLLMNLFSKSAWNSQPLWGWMPDGTQGPTTYDGMGDV